MRVCRSLLIGVLVFVAGFSLALESLWSRTCQQEIAELHDELSAAIELRNLAQDRYDSVVYVTLFEPGSTVTAQLSRPVHIEEAPVPVKFLVHDVPSDQRWREGHGLR